jgi:hypothetical protein
MSTFALEKLRKELFDAPQEFMVAFDRNPVGMYQNPVKTDEMTKMGGARASQYSQKPIWKVSTGSKEGMDNKCVGSSISKGLQCINERCTEERFINIYPKSRIDLLLEHSIDDWLNLSALRAQRKKDGDVKDEYRKKLANWRSIMRPVKVEIEKLLVKEWFDKKHSAYGHGGGRCKMSLTIWEPTRLELDEVDGLTWADGAFKIRINLRHFDCISSSKALKNKIGEDTYQEYQLKETMDLLVSFTITNVLIVCGIELYPDSGLVNHSPYWSSALMNPIYLTNEPYYDESDKLKNVGLGKV